MKLLCIFSNTTFCPCNCMGFIVMASDQILPIPVLMCSRACVLHMPPRLVVTSCCRQKILAEDMRTCITHVSAHPAFLFGTEAPGIFKAKFIFFFKEASGSLAAPQKLS